MQGKIAIVGTGLIGRAWAVSFARGGHEVALFDPLPGAAERTLALLGGMVEDLERQGLLHGQGAAAVAARVTVAASLADALDGAVHVQESAPETLEAKRPLYAAMDAAAGPDTILCSSTSGLLPSAFTEALAGRHRCLVGHPINPPYLVPAVELVPAPWTSPETVERTRALMEGIGQAPIVMKREIDGFIMNRLQGALLQEAFRLVAEGYADAADVDAGIAKGLGLRWAFMGPFETIDLNAPAGVADYVARYEGMYRAIAERQAHVVPWAGALAEQVEAERRQALPRDGIAARQAWRDRRLMALARHLRAAEGEHGA
jgi:3-hydroxyacyl-CoA dehydrogenase